VFLILKTSFYDIVNRTGRAGICDSKDLVSGIGTPTAHFKPSRTYGRNCDSIRVPRGEFDCVFYGDSMVVMSKTDYRFSTLWEFRLNNQSY
jgi:hypothetical protein